MHGSLPNGHSKEVPHLQAITGARVGEIAALLPEDYHAASGTLYLHGSDEGRARKGKKAKRPSPLPAAGRKVIADQLAAREGVESPYLFPMGAHVAPSLNGLLATACEAAGVHRFSTHGLRGMVVIRMLDAGVDAKTVSKLTGHSLKTLLAHYVRPTPAHLQRRGRAGRARGLRPQGRRDRLPGQGQAHGRKQALTG